MLQRNKEVSELLNLRGDEFGSLLYSSRAGASLPMHNCTAGPTAVCSIARGLGEIQPHDGSAWYSKLLVFEDFCNRIDLDTPLASA